MAKVAAPSAATPMPLAVALTSDIAKNAGVAYVHYLSFMLCFGALVLERKLIKADPNRQEATAMVITDTVSYTHLRAHET